MNSKSKKLEAFARLLDIMDLLRNECPWDKKQTIESGTHLFRGRTPVRGTL